MSENRSIATFNIGVILFLAIDRVAPRGRTVGAGDCALYRRGNARWNSAILPAPTLGRPIAGRYKSRKGALLCPFAPYHGLVEPTILLPQLQPMTASSGLAPLGESVPALAPPCFV